MKTPDEIKKGLECCRHEWVDHHWKTCDVACPNLAEGSYCKNVLHHDALAYIRQLEAERDAAVADMKNSRDCQCCKHYDVKWDEPCVHCDNDNNCFEWRGVQEEDGRDFA